MKAHHGRSYCLKHWLFEFSPGSNTKVTSKGLGPSKETYTEATKTKTSSFGEQWRKYGTLTSMGEKLSHCKFQIKSNNAKHSFRSEKTIIFLDRKYMVKSSHQECIVTKPKKDGNSEQLSSCLVVSTQSFIIPEVKTSIILSGDKYIVVYHPSANIAPYSAQATRSYLFWWKVYLSLKHGPFL